MQFFFFFFFFQAEDGIRDKLVTGVQTCALPIFYPLVATDRTEPYQEPSAWVRAFAPGEGVVNTEDPAALASSAVGAAGEAPPVCAGARLRAGQLGAMPAALHGLTFPLAPDLEGTFSPLHSLVLLNLPRFDWEARLPWLRLFGVDGVVIPGAPEVAGLRLLDRRQDFGVARGLYRVEGSGPAVFWPRAVETVASPVAALKSVSFGGDPFATAVVPSPVAHRGGGEARLVGETADRLEIETRGPGGLVVVQRAYQPLYAARSGEQRLQTLPANLALLGIVVPPGNQRILIEVTAGSEKVAGAAALATGAILALVAARGERPRNTGTE